MTSKSRSLLSRLAAAAALTGTLAACAAFDRPVPFRTVDGPESPGILAGLAGRFAIDEGRSSFCYPLRTIDPSRQQRCLPHLEIHEWVAAIAPDREKSVLRMRMTRPPGPSAEAVRLPIDVTLEAAPYFVPGQAADRTGGETIARWTVPPGLNLYNQILSLSPDGKRAAIVPESDILRGPGYSARSTAKVRFQGSRLVGELKIVDLQKKTIEDTGVVITDAQPVTWSQDGRCLLLVRAETVDRLPPRLAAEVVGDEGRAGQGVPVVEILDLQTRARTMLAIGQQPVWSTDGRTVLYQPADDHVELLDVGDLTHRPVVLPGMSTRYAPIAIAFVAPRKVLYWALPTTGIEPEFTINNSPLAGPKQIVSLKVADLDTGAFATVMPSLDPRARVGYRAR